MATRAQQIWRLPLLRDGTMSKAGVAIQPSGGVASPDGMESDAEGGLVVCHLYMVDSMSGDVLRARLPVSGLPMFGLAGPGCASG